MVQTDSMDLTSRTLKIFIKGSSLLLMLFGICTGVSGVLLLHTYRSIGLFFIGFFTLLPGVLALIVGVCLFVGGCIGCVLSKNHSCLQALFAYFLIFISCVMITAGALAYIHTSKLDLDLAPFKDVFQNYSGDSKDPDTREVNALQRELQCCGIRTYRDWIDTPWFNHTGKYEVPQSCCNKTFPTCDGTLDSPKLLYTEGCQIKLKEKIHFALNLIIFLSFILILILIFAGISVGHLMKHHPPMEYQILDQ